MSRFKHIGVALIVLIVLCTALWLVLDQSAWQIQSRDGNGGSYTTSLAAVSTFAAAIFTMVTALGAAVYAVLTYGLWQATRAQSETQRRTSETALMQSLMTGYDGMRDAVGLVHDFYLSHPTHAHAVNAFRDAKRGPAPLSDVLQRVDNSRFRVSRFFVGIRKLALAGYLDREIIKAALGREAIEDVFLGEIDPLDQEISLLVHQRRNVTDTNFFLTLVNEMSAKPGI